MGEAWERGYPDPMRLYRLQPHDSLFHILSGSTSALQPLSGGLEECWNETSLMKMTRELTHTILSLEQKQHLSRFRPSPPSNLQHTVKVRSGDKASLNLH